ncbi:hypothetical protein BDN70DRAFT_937403 [Pholiota conissans]|uniref:Uncharacterized protein n=1 Tax=Pholiota conissans TaxID=109636 RepID=A0A9P5YPD5_9AGAR|nr:hypothetical protein BDN70DRAFT_937403 [Pholiota conissans]
MHNNGTGEENTKGRPKKWESQQCVSPLPPHPVLTTALCSYPPLCSAPPSPHTPSTMYWMPALHCNVATSQCDNAAAAFAYAARPTLP